MTRRQASSALVSVFLLGLVALVPLSDRFGLFYGGIILAALVVVALAVGGILLAVTGDWPEVARLIHRGDYVAPDVAARIREQADAAAELDERLGVTRATAKRPERRQRSATGAFSRPWGSR